MTVLSEFRVPHAYTGLIDEPVRVLGFVIASILFMCLLSYASGNGLAEGFDMVGISKHSVSLLPAKITHLRGGRDLMYDAMAKLKKGFYVCSMEGPVLILPSKYVEEIKNKRQMSFNGFFARSFFPLIPGFEGNKVTLQSSVLKDAVRTKLTQSLGPVSLDLCEQTNYSVEEIYGSPTEWKTWDVRTHANNLIAILSTRVFLGERLIHNKEWIRITVDYTINMMIAVRTLKLVPEFLQPYLHWIVPHCILLRRDRTQARKIINKEIEIRATERADNAAMGIPPSKFADSLGWMQDLAGDAPFDLAGAQLSLTFAAIHTTSDMVSKSLYWIAAYPEIADAIRKEAVEVLTQEGWKKTSLTKMRFLDSLMKEVQRLYPAGVVSLPRWTTEDVSFHDGFKIPKGQMTAVLTDGMRNPKVYKNPDEFDAWRFIKLAKETGDSNHWQFVTTSEDHFGFGHGVHACPGRFFAANEIKIALVFMVLKYDFRIVGLKERLAAKKEPVLCLGMDCILDPSLKFEYRRRKEEIDPIQFCVREVKE